MSVIRKSQRLSKQVEGLETQGKVKIEKKPQGRRRSRQRTPEQLEEKKKGDEGKKPAKAKGQREQQEEDTKPKCCICRLTPTEDGPYRDATVREKYGADQVLYSSKREQGHDHPHHDSCLAQWMGSLPEESRKQPFGCLICIGAMLPYSTGTECFDVVVAAFWAVQFDELLRLPRSTLVGPTRNFEARRQAFYRLVRKFDHPNLPNPISFREMTTVEVYQWCFELLGGPHRHRWMTYCRANRPWEKNATKMWQVEWDKLGNVRFSDGEGDYPD